MKNQHSGKKSRREQVLNRDNPIEYGFKEVKPLNFIQGLYLDAIKSNSVIFGVGSAGTGKTFVAASYAASQLFHRNINKVILTRPNVEVGNGLGFLPGDLTEKYAPYIAPFESIFTGCLGKGFYEYSLRQKVIDPQPLGFLRGATFENCIILADEMQNATKAEFKMLLTRLGKNCKIIISGDPDQYDISNSGLEDAVTRLDRIKDVEVVRFRDEDIVRSEICKRVIIAYKN